MLAIIRCKTFCFQFDIPKYNIKIYRNIILPVVLYECETWLLTSKEEGWLGDRKCRVLRKILRPKRDEVTGEWRKLHNEELYDM
jgi:hypothetical protein